MANIRIIRRRIKSTANIAQITRAMEMVAASKMKKAQDAALMGKPYVAKIYEAVKELASHINKKHPLLEKGKPGGKSLVILVSTNKGLCGGLNSNLFRAVDNWFPNLQETDYISIGKKGQSFIIITKRKLIADFSEITPFIGHVAGVAKLLIDGFMSGEYNNGYIVYNDFLNPLKQLPIRKHIVPLGRFEENSENTQESHSDKFAEFLIEPGVDEVLESLLPHYIENQIRASIFEAEASEHSARMIAMKNATDSALDIMDELTLIMNKVRQEKITFEIADMVTARLAVE